MAAPAEALPPAFLADWGGAHAPAALAAAPAEAASPSAAGDPGAAAVSASLAALTLAAGRPGVSGSTQPPGGASVDAAVERVAACAVSLAFLSDFYARCVAPLERAGGAPLTTKDVVTRVVIPATQAAAGGGNLASLVPLAVAPPTAFVSHAFGNPFALLLSALELHFMNAVAADVYIWLDIFAINQHQPAADLHGGRALARTIELSGETLVVLDRGAYPLTRLWCLYEMGSTPPDKLRLLTPGVREAELASAFRAVDVAAARCFDDADMMRIREHIVARHASLADFQRMLRLRLLLKPTSYEADRRVLLECCTDAWRFDALHAHVRAPGDDGDEDDGAPRLACITGGPGDGKSTLAAALCAQEGGAPPLVHAHHFCKASDVRRQDVGEVIRSLAYQLALRFSPVADALLALQQADAEQLLTDPRAAWELLLRQPLRLLRGARVVLLFDALDEAGGGGGGDGRVSGVLNLVLDLGRLADGAALTVIVTTRDEPPILAVLRSRWHNGARFFAPADLRASGDEQSRLLALLHAHPLCSQAETPEAAYAAIFDASGMEGDNKQALPVKRLLSVLMAAQQPPPLALLEAMGVRAACTALPSWGLRLFQTRDHCVHLLHRSLAEWLCDAGRSGRHVVDVGAGHCAWAEQLSAQVQPWLESGTPALSPPKGSYAYAHLLTHLDAAGRGAEARATLMRLPWLQATLRERGLHALLGDVAARMAPGDGTLSLLLRTLNLSAPGLLGGDAAEALPVQLVGRLGGLLDGAATEVARLYQEAHSWRGALAWLRPVTASLQRPVGALTQLMGLRGRMILSVVELDDGRIACSSIIRSQSNNTRRERVLTVWDGASGACLCTAELADATSTDDDVSAALAGGRLALGSMDSDRLLVLNAATGECELGLDGHGGVSALCVLPSGRVVVGTLSGDLRVWDLTFSGVHELAAPRGELVHTMTGHSKPVTRLLALPNGRVVSKSVDKTLRVWSTATGMCERVLGDADGGIDKHTPPVVLSGDRVVVRSGDGGLNVWNAATGACERTLLTYSNDKQLIALADGFVVCSCGKNALRFVDAATGASKGVHSGHDRGPRFLIALSDGARCVSGSVDGTLRVWHAATTTCERTLMPHGFVFGLTALGDGRFASRTHDGALRVWNASTTEREHAPETHKLTYRDALSPCVTSLLALADGRVASASVGDAAVRLWDAATGACVRTLDGHQEGVEGLLSLTGGRLMATSRSDATLRVWDADTGECVHTIQANNDTFKAPPLNKLVRLSDRQHVATVLRGKPALHVWDTSTGGCERTLTGHAAPVTSAVALPDGRLASESEDGELRVWNALTGVCEHTLEEQYETPPPPEDDDFWDPSCDLLALDDGPLVVRRAAPTRLSVWNTLTGEREGTMSVDVDGRNSAMIQSVSALTGNRLVCKVASYEERAETTHVISIATGECEQIPFRFCMDTSLTELRLPGFPGQPGRMAEVALATQGAFLVAPGFARTYVDTNVSTFEAVPINADTSETVMVAAGTDAGAVHFFSVRPPAGVD